MRDKNPCFKIQQSHAHAKQQVSLQLCSCPSLCRRTRDNFSQEIDDSTERKLEREREREWTVEGLCLKIKVVAMQREVLVVGVCSS